MIKLFGVSLGYYKLLRLPQLAEVLDDRDAN